MSREYKDLVSDMNEAVNVKPLNGSKVLIKRRWGNLDLEPAIYQDGLYQLINAESLEGSFDVSHWKYR